MVLVGAICLALLVWWDVSDGTRYSRTSQDLLLIDETAFADIEPHDPWGNPYVLVRAESSLGFYYYVFSCGPDGASETLGNDADDIAPWTTRFEWLAGVHPVRLTCSLFLLFGGAAVVSSVYFFARRDTNTTNPNKVKAP